MKHTFSKSAYVACAPTKHRIQHPSITFNQLIATALFTFLVISIQAQTIEVLDKSQLQPIQGVSIFVKNTNISATTDAKGKADISAIKAGDTITFRHLAYQELRVTKQELQNKKFKVFLTDAVIRLDEVVLSANKIEEKQKDIASRIEIIPAKEISFQNPQNSGDLLQYTGKAFVQSSQMGGGSPVIRGFEANRLLIVVDGIRMNNTIYRAGHLQSVITIDPNAIEKTEIVYGPGSVIYGSDALGGVMHFITVNPMLSANDSVHFHANAFVRYSSANFEKTGGFNLNLGWKKFGSFTAFTYKDYDDLRKGAAYGSKYGDWGKRLWYVETNDGVDSVYTNDDENIQKFTGYSQYDLLQKFLYRPSDKVKFTLNLQMSNSSSIPRYDRLCELKSGNPKFAEWYYGPQTRYLAALRADLHSDKGMYNDASIILAYQYSFEQRVSRNFDASGIATTKKRQFNDDQVHMGSINADFMKQLTEKNELRYGLEGLYNNVISEAYNQNIHTDEKTYDMVSRYPDGGVDQYSVAGYVSHNWEISPKLIFAQGVRFSYVSLKAAYTDTMFVLIQEPPINKVNTIDNMAVNGSVGLVYMPGYDWRLAFNLSSGFRAPNTDDAFKFNDSKPGNVIVVPNPELKPEYVYNGEITLGKTFRKKLTLQATGYYTYIINPILQAPYAYNGSDSVLWNGSMVASMAYQNGDQAYKCGIEANISAQITPWLSAHGALAYTYGRDMTDVPLDHIPPMYGIAGIKTEVKRFKGEVYVRFNGKKALKDFRPNSEDNIQVCPVDENGEYIGMPSWWTLNLRTGISLNKYLQIQAGVDNLLDLHYRNYASGISAPGRNVMITLRGSF